MAQTIKITFFKLLDIALIIGNIPYYGELFVCFLPESLPPSVKDESDDGVCSFYLFGGMGKTVLMENTRSKISGVCAWNPIIKEELPNWIITMQQYENSMPSDMDDVWG